jgi:hypothetical protein
MQLEARFYCAPRRKDDCGNWDILGKGTYQDGDEIAFFPGSEIQISQIRDWVIIFGSKDSKNIRVAFKDQEGEYISGDTFLPIVMESGQAVEIYTKNKSMDLMLQSVSSDKQM